MEGEREVEQGRGAGRVGRGGMGRELLREVQRQEGIRRMGGLGREAKIGVRSEGKERRDKVKEEKGENCYFSQILLPITLRY